MKKNVESKKYKIIEGVKLGMSQLFDDSASVIPYTSVKATLKEGEAEYLKSLDYNTPIKLVGYTKGRGYTGVMKRWNFHGGPATHGQKIKHRSPGSIGTQGQGHVTKGHKMAGRYGAERVSVSTYYLNFDESNNEIKIKGGIPGARNSKVYLYLSNQNEN